MIVYGMSLHIYHVSTGTAFSRMFTKSLATSQQRPELLEQSSFKKRKYVFG